MPRPQYVFLESVSPLLDQILSLETFLGRVYSVNMFQGPILPI